MDLGVLDWIPTHFCRRDLGRQVARSPGGSPAAEPKVATPGVLPPVAGQLPAQPQFSGTDQD